jgi:hypothetical protein
VVREYIMAEEAAHIMVAGSERERERKGLMSKYLLQGHTPVN